jgi:plastocyanin domain-containing protein
MLAFSLGTLPALLTLSAASSLASGSFQRHFVRFAGAAVIVLGLANIQYGLALTGSDMSEAVATNSKPAVAPPAQEIAGGEKQIVVMRIEGFSYVPSHFTVKQGIPVEWRIDASEAADCGRMLLAPRLGIRRILSDRSTTMISFVPEQAGDFGFNCGMGMMTPGKFSVLPRGRG